MELREGLLTRRTISTFSKQPVDRDIVKRATECAMLAPNHKNTEPWHFYILEGESKEKLAKRRGYFKASKFEEGDERAKTAQEKGYQSMVDLPWVVVVTARRTPEDPVRDREDYAAVSAAIQNFMLSVWSEGVGTKWSTGALVQDEEVARIISAEENEEVVGILFVGYPEGTQPKPKKRHEAESITWLD
ncbi:nitroreductase family protein [Alteribacillus iranensis]|uniref:Putative NAD(P)H nitroreductase n=1 Tax=Alteribacillus iranensis TaxID=930128 RepID=A0A1I2ADB4_9BACI|nr:nitroreductase [Alteribacillus iranensis]SFE41886.1 Nitroreductase [Alteribacillus iranensis]